MRILRVEISKVFNRRFQMRGTQHCVIYVHFYQNVLRAICLLNKIHRKRKARKRDEEMIGSVRHSNKWRVTFSCGGVARA